MASPRLRALAGFLAVALVVCSMRVSAAWAQVATPPDLVRLKSGGMLRGTILELVPDKEVTFVGADGQPRKIPMSDVAFAGPSAQDPLAAPAPAVAPVPAAAPAPAPTPQPPHLRLRAVEPDVTYFVKTGTSRGYGGGYALRGGPVVVGVNVDHFERLCTAPCETQLDPGTWVLGLARGAGTVIEAPAISLRGDEQLTGRFVSRTSLRLGLVIAGLAALAASAYLTYDGTQSCDRYERDTGALDCTDGQFNETMFGILGFGVSTLLLLVPIFIRDRAEVVASP